MDSIFKQVDKKAAEVISSIKRVIDEEGEAQMKERAAKLSEDSKKIDFYI